MFYLTDIRLFKSASLKSCFNYFKSYYLRSPDEDILKLA